MPRFTGVKSIGVRAPIIREGDDMKKLDCTEVTWEEAKELGAFKETALTDEEAEEAAYEESDE